MPSPLMISGSRDSLLSGSVTPPPKGRVSSGAGRRDVVLTAALETFVRYGYRKTSMEDIARAARISRPGLYFLFESKQELFAAAITRALQQDLRAAARALDDEARPLHERLLEAFDIWTGRYIGAVGGELSAVAEAHRDVLGAAALDAPHRFHALVTDTIVSTRAQPDHATSEAIARTLISTAVGLKHQTTSRDLPRRPQHRYRAAPAITAPRGLARWRAATWAELPARPGGCTPTGRQRPDPLSVRLGPGSYLMDTCP